MSKHTPGPWFIDTSLHVYGQEEPQPIKDFPGGLSVTCPHICTANTVANARLIAAAPEMLDALKRAIGQFKTLQRHISGLYKKRSPAFENEKLLIASICNGGIVEISDLLKKVEGEE